MLAGVGAWLFLRSSKSSSPSNSTHSADDGKDYSQAESITYYAGAGGATQGLKHLLEERDGSTTVHILDGVPTRMLALADGRTTLNFYFKIHTTFKRDELRS